jgi:Resolvase, N terminal domain
MLEARCRAPGTPQGDVKRAQIVLLAAEGRSTRSIAKEVGVQPRIVSNGGRGFYCISQLRKAKVEGWAMVILRYARVSTNGQDLAGQVAELQAAGCREKVSGAKTDRQELGKPSARVG